ncbi:AraC family transcriptional regulator [Pseudonocardia sp. KRD291]|uniref:AraC family transcriptional regulator n=1 Tax=Pseudonocardia sp. KRD291 TaxID=2792007 RepID=UPI001C49EE31|nr:AraC family transcriptional regulator [Pseudonocardia sp. KRD291]MBW0101118.1 AraC family transcriptional regulator [Pseudonocardia sp. KRD291]
MASMIRAAALRGLTPLVDSLGGDGAALLARFRVPPGAVDPVPVDPAAGDATEHGDATDPGGPDAPDVLIRSATAGRILETAAAELDCPDLGLRLAEHQGPDVLGPLAVAVENSATMGEALDCASRFLFVHSPALRVSRIDDPEGAPGVMGLLYGSTEPDPPPPQAVDLGLGVFHRIVLVLGGGPYGLRSAHLPHPPLAPVSRYREFFGTDVRFERDAAVLRVPSELASRPMHGGDETVRAIAIDYLENHFDRPGRTVTDRVRTALVRSLGTSPARIPSVARLLRMHPRTLQRHLAAEGTTFETVLDEVRREAAHRLITRSDLPFSQVTAMIGLAEQSALTRASRRWFGDTPRAVRRAAGP